jgi:hypothetical protein
MTETPFGRCVNDPTWCDVEFYVWIFIEFSIASSP